MQKFMQVVALLCIEVASAPSAVAQHTAIDLAQELERRTAGLELWPEYDPQTIPLAVYDGQQTYFFRHPAPPEGSISIDVEGLSVFVLDGRHPAIVANSTAEIGGVSTATMLVDRVGAEQSLTDLAAIAAHEAFHVFQSARRPDWGANEADLFVFPVDDADLLALRRLETEALRRAIASEDAELAACWAQAAIELRLERYERMPDQFASYERGTELNEGIASYVEAKVAGRAPVDIPEGGFSATDVRLRCYATGTAFGFLLDRLNPNWRASFAQAESPTLDAALREALVGAEMRACAFTDEELREIRRAADEAISRLVANRTAERVSFDKTPGWQVRIEAAADRPLWPQGFDPINIRRIQGGVLHSRFLRLGNDAGRVELMDTEDADLAALTVGAGEHPLLNGVRRLSIVGLSEPMIESSGGSVTLSAPGLTLEFRTADLERLGDVVVIRLR